MFVPSPVWNVTLPDPPLYIPKLYSPLICVKVSAKMLIVLVVPVNIMFEFLKLVDATPAIDKVVPSVYVARFKVVAKFTFDAVVAVDATPVNLPVKLVEVNTPVDGLYDNGRVVSSIYNC